MDRELKRKRCFQEFLLRIAPYFSCSLTIYSPPERAYIILRKIIEEKEEYIKNGLKLQECQARSESYRDEVLERQKIEREIEKTGRRRAKEERSRREGVGWVEVYNTADDLILELEGYGCHAKIRGNEVIVSPGNYQGSYPHVFSLQNVNVKGTVIVEEDKK